VNCIPIVALATHALAETAEFNLPSRASRTRFMMRSAFVGSFSRNCSSKYGATAAGRRSMLNERMVATASFARSSSSGMSSSSRDDGCDAMPTAMPQRRDQPWHESARRQRRVGLNCACGFAAGERYGENTPTLASRRQPLQHIDVASNQGPDFVSTHRMRNSAQSLALAR